MAVSGNLQNNNNNKVKFEMVLEIPIWAPVNAQVSKYTVE